MVTALGYVVGFLDLLNRRYKFNYTNLTEPSLLRRLEEITKTIRIAEVGKMKGRRIV
jgi:hypothetical protein